MVLSLLALGCDPFSTEHSFKNEGRVCLLPANSSDSISILPPTTPLDYQANQPLTLAITMPDCLSSSCSHDEKAACTASVNGNVVDVQSTASYTERGTTCTADCRILVARCSTPPLPPGSYEIRHGTTTLAITIPSTVTPPCGGKGIGGP